MSLRHTVSCSVAGLARFMVISRTFSFPAKGDHPDNELTRAKFQQDPRWNGLRSQSHPSVKPPLGLQTDATLPGKIFCFWPLRPQTSKNKTKKDHREKREKVHRAVVAPMWPCGVVVSLRIPNPPTWVQFPARPIFGWLAKATQKAPSKTRGLVV